MVFVLVGKSRLVWMLWDLYLKEQGNKNLKELENELH